MFSKMCNLNCIFITVVIVFLNYSYTAETSTKSIEILLKSYEYSVNASKELDKSDNLLLSSWAENFQMRLVNLTTDYRIQMIRHKDYNFHNNLNYKWRNCTHIFRKRIKKTEHEYYERESACQKTAMAAGDEKKQATDQIRKEIRKWRRSYKYLINRCSLNNPDSPESAGSCLVEYIEKDNYLQTLQRLMLLKLEATDEFYKELTRGVNTLEDCLKSCLSIYLEDVRKVMEILQKCYSGHEEEEHN